MGNVENSLEGFTLKQTKILLKKIIVVV